MYVFCKEQKALQAQRMTGEVGAIESRGWDKRAARRRPQEAAPLRIAISGHVEVIGAQQQSLHVGRCLGALQGEEVRDIHVG